MIDVLKVLVILVLKVLAVIAAIILLVIFASAWMADNREHGQSRDFCVQYEGC